MTYIANRWKNYTLVDAGNGEKLEIWGDVLLRRPDPTAIWPINPQENRWKEADAVYQRSSTGGGHWEYKRKLPEDWTITYDDLSFKVAPTGFKHTGLFPEQAVNWDWMKEKIQSRQSENIRILNLFAYTGAATMACAMAGASEVVHVDASKGMVQWAKENMSLNGLNDRHIRFIVDDCVKFCQREKRRGRTYHGILMDPPSYGRGPSGEMWKFEKEIVSLLSCAISLLDENALFLLVNSYTAGFSPIVLDNLMQMALEGSKLSGVVETGDIALPLASRKMLLPCGILGRWSPQ